MVFRTFQYISLPFIDISKAPVDNNCPSTALQTKNIMIHEYSLFLVHHVHQDGSCKPRKLKIFTLPRIHMMSSILTAPWTNKMCGKLHIYIYIYIYCILVCLSCSVMISTPVLFSGRTEFKDLFSQHGDNEITYLTDMVWFLNDTMSLQTHKYLVQATEPFQLKMNLWMSKLNAKNTTYAHVLRLSGPVTPKW